jgi:hypothetical protein
MSDWLQTARMSDWLQTAGMGTAWLRALPAQACQYPLHLCSTPLTSVRVTHTSPASRDVPPLP